MKFSRPALTVLTSVILAGTVACGQDEVVSDAGDLNRTDSAAETADQQNDVVAQNDNTTATGQTGTRQQPIQRDQAGNGQADTALTPLAADAVESGVIPEELTEEGSGLNRLAVARVEPTEGNEAMGLVSFIETEGEPGIRIVARLTGLADGDHGFHIHENGDCSAPDASSAGDHFNPANEPHGGPEEQARHRGDLGNVTAMDGEAMLDITDEQLSFDGDNSVVGKAILVHAGQDDLDTQPSGDSGDPIACGVIEVQDVNALTRN